jgi:hypothetical protein
MMPFNTMGIGKLPHKIYLLQVSFSNVKQIRNLLFSQVPVFNVIVSLSKSHTRAHMNARIWNGGLLRNLPTAFSSNDMGTRAQKGHFSKFIYYIL